MHAYLQIILDKIIYFHYFLEIRTLNLNINPLILKLILIEINLTKK